MMMALIFVALVGLAIILPTNRAFNKITEKDIDLDMQEERYQEPEREADSSFKESRDFYVVLIKSMLEYLEAIRREVDDVEEREKRDYKTPNSISNGTLLRFYVLEREMKERMTDHLAVIDVHGIYSFLDAQKDYKKYKNELEDIVTVMGLEEKHGKYAEFISKNIREWSKEG